MSRLDMRRFTLAAVAGYVAIAVAVLLLTGTALHAPDEREYLAIGRHIAQAGFFSIDGIAPTAWRSPGLPVLIAAFWSVWPSVAVLKCANMACWMATGYFATRIATHLSGRRAGQIAACLYPLNLYSLYAATTLYPQTVLGLLATSSVWLVLRSAKLDWRRQILLCALTIVEVCLVPNAVVVPVSVYAFALIRKTLRFGPAVLAAALTVAVVLGWCSRNERMIGVFEFTTSMGVTLYDGNRPGVSPSTAGGPDAIALPDGGRGMTEAQLDKVYRAYATTWMNAHPWQAAKLAAGKFLYFFAPANTMETRTNIPFMGVLTALTAVLYFGVLAGAACACLSRVQSVRESAWLAWSIYLGTAMTYAVFLTRIRYRLPYDPLLLALAAAMLDAAAIALRQSPMRAALMRNGAWAKPKPAQNSAAGNTIRGV